MAKFESTIGKSNINGNSPSMKSFTVDDASEGSYDNSEYNQPKSDFRQSAQASQFTEDDIIEARKRKQYESTHINPGAKKRIEMLSGIGRAHKDIPVDSTVFSIRTLKSSEQLEVLLSSSKIDLTIQAMFDQRAQTLARSIYAIDGQDIDLIVGPTVDEKLFAVQQLDEAVINYIFDHYNKLVKQNTSKFSISTPEEVKEVVEDIKK